MMTYTDPSPSTQPVPSAEPPRKKHTLRKWLLISTAAFAAIIAAVVTLSLVFGAAVDSTQRHAAAASSAPATTAPPDTAPAAEPAPTPEGPAQLAAGESGTVTQDGQDAATVTVTSVTVTTRPADPEFGSHPANGYYVIARVTVTADPAFTEGFDAYTGDFYALARGQHYDEGNGNSYSALSDSQMNSQLSFTSLAAGETSRGLLVFDVPAAHGQIVYAPNYDGQPLAEWKY
jgi:Domain of unknown function (DUF4352)